MSSKNLRRALLDHEKEEEVDSADDDVHDRATHTRRGNAFAALCDDEEDQPEIQSSSDDETPAPPAAVEKPVAAASEKKKRKKKKKKAKQNTVVDKDWAALAEVENDKNASGATSSAVDGGPSTVRDVLRFEYKNMDAEKELMAIINNAVKGGGKSAVAQNRQQRGAAVLGRIVKFDGRHWEPFHLTGLSMDLVETRDDGVQVFVFKHSHAYQQLQTHFWTVADSGDSNALFELLQSPHFSYHVDFNTLVAAGFMMQEEKEHAFNRLGRAIYACEQSFHTAYRVAAAQCALPYKYRENRTMHIALMRHTQWLSKRCCNRSALEVCKLLYQLDGREDALGCIFVIDALALRSQQYAWLIDCLTTMQSSAVHAAVLQLPNIMFSHALATFLLAHSEKNRTMARRATALLTDAMLAYPTLLLRLMDRCSVEVSASITKCAAFHQFSKDAVGCRQLIDVYAYRMSDVYKQKHIIDWLMDTAQKVVGKIDQSAFAQQWKEKRQGSSTFGRVPPNLIRHIILSADLGTMPWHMVVPSEHTMAYDPCPPTDGIDGYERKVEAELNPDDTWLEALLRSLDVNYDPEARAAEQAAEEERGVPAERGVMAAGRNVARAMQQMLADAAVNLRVDNPNGGNDGANDAADNIDELD